MATRPLLLACLAAPPLAACRNPGKTVSPESRAEPRSVLWLPPVDGSVDAARRTSAREAPDAEADGASAQGSGNAEPWTAQCLVPLSQAKPVTFSECNPHPTVTSRPDCYVYSLVPPDAVKTTCLPGPLGAGISGPLGDWTALAVDARLGSARSESSMDIELHLVRVEGSQYGFSAPADGLLGVLELSIRDGRVRSIRLRFGPAMPSKFGSIYAE